MARGFAFALRRRRCPQELPAALDPPVGLEVGPRFPVLAAFPHLEEGRTVSAESGRPKR